MVTMAEDGAAWMQDGVAPRKVKGRAVLGRVDAAVAADGAVAALANLAFANYRVNRLPASKAKPIYLRTVAQMTAAADVALYGPGGGGLDVQGVAAFAISGPDKADIRAFFAAMDEAKLGLVINSVDSYYRIGWTFYDHLSDMPGVVFSRSTAASALDAAGALHDFAVDVPRETDRGWLISRGGNNLVKAYQNRKIGLNGTVLQGAGTARLVDKSADLAGTDYAALVEDGMVYEIDNIGDLVNSSYLQFDAWATVVDDTYTCFALMWVASEGMIARTDVTNAAGLAEQSTSSLTPEIVALTFPGTSLAHQPYVKAAPGSKIWCAFVGLGEGADAPPLPILARRPTAFVGDDAGNLATNVLDPVDTSLVTKRGDAAAAVSLVDDTADVKLKDMLPGKETDKVYRLNNLSGGSSANIVAVTAATVIGETYVPFAWIRVLTDTGRLGIDNAPGGYSEEFYTKKLWKLVEGDAFEATSASHVAYAKASPHSDIHVGYMGLWHGSTLPDTIRALALAAPEYGDDQATIPVPTADGMVVEWLGLTTVADVDAGTADIGVSGDVPWDGTYIKARSRRAGETLPTATPQSAVSFLQRSFTKRRAGTALDMALYPDLVFSETFDAASWGDSDNANMAVKNWAGPGHSSYGGSTFVKPSADTLGLYSIVDADGGKALRLGAVKNAGKWYSGGLSTINDAGQGRTFGIGSYVEARIRLGRGKAGWGAWWASNQATAANDNHCEIDFLEWYWSDAGDPDTGEGAHEHGTGHAWKPYPVIGAFAGTHWQSSRTASFTFDPTAFYNFGCAITDKWVIWYRNGVETRRMPLWPEVRLRGLHLLLTLAILETEAGLTDDPLHMDVSHVKVWQQAA